MPMRTICNGLGFFAQKHAWTSFVRTNLILSVILLTSGTNEVLFINQREKTQLITLYFKTVDSHESRNVRRRNKYLEEIIIIFPIFEVRNYLWRFMNAFSRMSLIYEYKLHWCCSGVSEWKDIILHILFITHLFAYEHLAETCDEAKFLPDSKKLTFSY
jgi:hypothetical protein